MTSATNRKQIAARNKQIAEDRDVDKQVITALMSRPDGRRWIWRQLEFAQVFIGNENLDPQYMAFEKGRRNEGLRLLANVTRYAPDAYVRMTSENSGVKLEEMEDAGSDDDDPAS